MVDVANQIIERPVNTRQRLTRESAIHCGVSAHPHEYRIIVAQQLLNRDIATNLGIESELNPHTLEYLATPHHDIFFKLELWNAEGEQPTNFGVSVEHNRFDARTGEYISTTQSSGPRTNDCHAFTCRHNARQVGAPAHGQCSISNIFFSGTDSHRAKTVVKRARTFAQSILRAHTPAHFGQCIRLMAELGSFK